VPNRDNLIPPRGRHEIVIQQDNASGGVTYHQAGDHQSVADSQGVSTAEYIHALYGFIRQSGARRVLMIGGGGGTLATMLARGRIAVTILDVDPLSFEIARRYFHMPAGVVCHLADGAAWLRRHAERYDAIVLDAYANEKIPRHLTTAAFFASVKARLARGGIFLTNLIVKDDADRHPDIFCRRLKTVFASVKLLDADGWVDRNAIALAGGIKGLKPPRLMLRPKIGAKRVAKLLKGLDFRDLRG
jgi:spermidine synthase